MMIISKGNVTDFQSTVNAVVEASKHPISIILVAVGDSKENKAKFKKLDGDGFTLIHSVTKEEAARDIV